MDLAIYQVDAFTDRAFAGNPAGVMPLQSWLPDAKMQAIAAEMLPAVAACFDLKPVELHESFAYLALFEDASQVERLTPDFQALNALDRDVIVTARGKAGIDFVSRFFAPLHGIPEDPVTGGAHCILAPFWAGVLGKTRFHARQVSARGGDLWLALEGDRVKIAGHSVCVLKGTISV